MARPLRVALLAVAVAAASPLGGCRVESESSGDDVESGAPSPSRVVSTSGAASATAIVSTPVAPTIEDPSTTTTTSTTSGTTTSGTTTTATTTTTTSTTTSTTSTTSTTTTVPAPTTTRCSAVVHLGDSTSVGLFDPAFMPDPGDALPAQYERVGVQALYTEVSGGRSTIETIGGNENAFDTVLRLRGMGYQGCWVVTIGTNDAANVAIGGVPDLNTRLDRMMVLFGADPVLWVDAVTNVAEGPYADVNMQMWNEVLDTAEARFPTLRVFRWSDVALDEWFVSDGIHYTSGGAAWRSHAIADALVTAFPADAP